MSSWGCGGKGFNCSPVSSRENREAPSHRSPLSASACVVRGWRAALKTLKGKLEEEGLSEQRISGMQVQEQIKELNPLTVRFSNLRNKFLNFPGSFCRI